MRKRMSMMVLGLTTVALLVPASPASATKCPLDDPGVGTAMCLIDQTPGPYDPCTKLPVC